VLFGPLPVEGGENFVLLIRGTNVMLGAFGSNGPTSEPCSRWDAPASATPPPTPVKSHGVGHAIPAIDARLVPAATIGAACPMFIVNPHVTGRLAGTQDDAWVVWLVDPAGRRLDVRWPKGFSVTVVPSSMSLLDEGNRVVAHTGQTVELEQVQPAAHSGTADDPYLAEGLVFGTCYTEAPSATP
jgi:hypothetical protein